MISDVSGKYADGYSKIDWSNGKTTICLEIPKRHIRLEQSGIVRSVDYEYIIEDCLPFFLNRRGILVHRPRFAFKITHEWVSRRTGLNYHYHVDYECGNGCNFYSLDDFIAEPPSGRLICEACELKATMRGQKASDDLAGRHCHKGRMIPIRTCCQDCKN